MIDRYTPDADAKAEAEQASAATGTLQAGFTEAGHAFQADIQVNELQKIAAGLMSVSAATTKAALDSITVTRATNAAVIDNLAHLSNQLVQDFGNKAMHRHSEIAADRQWNVNETDLYAVVAGAVTAAMMETLGERIAED